MDIPKRDTPHVMTDCHDVVAAELADDRPPTQDRVGRSA
jgi:hypothetical protein